MQKDNTATVLYQLVKALDINVTQRSIEDETTRHPEPNSLLAVSEMLDHWNIPNAAYKLPPDELGQIPVPFVAFFLKRGFVLVTEFDGQHITISNEYWNNHLLGFDEFKLSYSGSILVAEKDVDSGEVDYKQKRKKEILNKWRIPAVLLSSSILMLICLLTNFTYFQSFKLQIGLLTLFKTAGVVTTVLLLIQSIDANNPFIQKLCTGGNNNDCNAILSSIAAKITNELSWSEAGFFYFAGTWLTLVFNSNNVTIIQALAILNIVSLPYTFYSIYYQWRVAKQWCVFCCTIQGLLWLEFFAFLPYLFHNVQMLGLTDWVKFITGMTIPILAWVIFKPYLLQRKEMQSLKKELNKLKYNRTLFNKLLNNEPQHELPDEHSSLVIGNHKAEKVITMVSNPLCQPCSEMHKKLDELLKNRNDIKLQVIFFIPDENDKKIQIMEHLMSLQAEGRNDLTKKALDDWYEHKNFEKWVETYPAKTRIDCQRFLKAQMEWCKTAKVMSTPVIFINGRKLFQSYQPEDIRYFI